MSAMPTTLLDQPQRLAADEDLRVVALAPTERRDVAILAQGAAAVSFLEARLERGPDVRIGAAGEQQPRERRVVGPARAIVDPEVVLRNARRVERRVPAEPARVGRRAR